MTAIKAAIEELAQEIRLGQDALSALHRLEASRKTKYKVKHPGRPAGQKPNLQEAKL